MGLFETLSRARQLGADTLAVKKYSKEIFDELQSLIYTLRASNNQIGYSENNKIQSIGVKINMLLLHTKNLGVHMTSTPVWYGPRKMELIDVIDMIDQTTTAIQNDTGCNFRITP